MSPPVVASLPIGAAGGLFLPPRGNSEDLSSPAASRLLVSGSLSSEEQKKK
ncbi:hypothetical protein NQZ68_042188 [Dissostichus eleginoides]|nr:hypothetical protein NQZ68_042188 [Dissostichus eleginoides]